MGSIGVLCVLAALVVAGLLRWLPVKGRTAGVTAAGVAGVRGGSKAALAVAVVELHLAEVIVTGRGGRLRRVTHGGPGRNVTSLHRAAWTVFGRDLSLADAATAPPVRRARQELNAELAGRGLRCGRARSTVAGLLFLTACGTAVAAAAHGSLPAGLSLAVLSLAVLCGPARTLAGHRLLRELRRLHPRPASAPAAPAETGLLVALHGRRALRLLVPEFAARAGLLGGRAVRETVARSGGGPYEGSAAESAEGGSF
ncbi:hypothetical protein ACIQ9P_06010 [Kitasatospora sp. NPDC094019]|uniref:hypothetical protein n=1 Tax=Kitasatospora sp. NPDC094019 TaxID=3364091 RepID=UPI003807D53F